MKLKKFTQLGTRENNEDFLGHNSNAIIVCDGVGGHAAGEVASKFIVEKMLQLTENPKQEINKTSIQQYLQEAQLSLNKLLDKNPEQAKMGTTFTGLFKTEYAFFAAHIGDSRIYFIRPSEQKIWHTWDHSLVGELMRTGEITREAGRKHPMGNRIARAITANEEGKTAKADILKIDELKTGDIFMLCSDGVNEAWPEHELTALLCNTDLSLEQKTEKITQKCNEFSKDNNTAYLVEIEEADVISVGNNEEITWLTLNYFEADYQKHLTNIAKEEAEDDDNVVFVENVEVKEEPKAKKEEAEPNIEKPIVTEKQGKNKKTLPLKEIIIVILLVATAYMAYERFFDNKEDGKGTEETVISKKPLKDSSNKTKANIKENKAEEAAWKIATDKNTIKSYNEFIIKFPESYRLNTAKDKIKKLKAALAKTEKDKKDKPENTIEVNTKIDSLKAMNNKEIETDKTPKNNDSNKKKAEGVNVDDKKNPIKTPSGENGVKKETGDTLNNTGTEGNLNK